VVLEDAHPELMLQLAQGEAQRGLADVQDLGGATEIASLLDGDHVAQLGIFQTRTVSGANVAGFIMGTAMFSMLLMLTLYMQQVLGYSAMKTGVAYLAVAGTAIIWSAVAGQLVTRVGVKPVLVVGVTMLTAGLLFFTQVSVGGGYVRDLLPG
jgi:Na+/melibiose symporter-like transporter